MTEADAEAAKGYKTQSHFTDLKDRKWHLCITVGDLKDLRELGLKTHPVADAVDWIARTAFEDPIRLLDVAAVIAKPVTPPTHEWGKDFNGLTLLALSAALAHAVIDFVPNPQRAAALRAAFNGTATESPDEATESPAEATEPATEPAPTAASAA